MPSARDYNIQTFLNPSKNKPKLPGLATPRFSPSSIFAGRPSDSANDSDSNFALQGGLAGSVTQPIASPFASTFLFKKRK